VYAALDAILFKRDQATFTFEHLASIMTKAFSDLHRFREPVIESKKVQDLLSKISDPKLEAAKQTIHITLGYRENFAAMNFLAQSVVPLSNNIT